MDAAEAPWLAVGAGLGAALLGLLLLRGAPFRVRIEWGSLRLSLERRPPPRG